MSGLSQQLAESLVEFSRRHEAADQPDWLQALRGHARGLFLDNGLPGPGVERWKYTSLRALERRAPALVPGRGTAAATAVTEPLLADVPRVAMVNGDWSLTAGPSRPGLTVLPLHQALARGDAALRSLLESLEIEHRAEGFSALNTAALGRGLFIRVARDTDAGPLLLQWLGTAEKGNELANSRICVVLETGARLELLEQFENGPDGAPILNQVLQGRIGRGAELRHTRLQHESTKAVLVTRTEIRQAGGSRYHYTGLDLGGGLVRHDVRAQLLESGAACHLHSACLAGGRSHIDNHIDVDHLAPDCTSSQVFRGVLDDRSRAVFNGRVYVAEGADGTEARQSSAGLLLSPHAEIDTKPELEILADEVVASHGATVGQLDEDAIFYLRSRGLDTATSRQLLTMAFCRTVVDLLPPSALRDALGARLMARLEAGGLAS